MFKERSGEVIMDPERPLFILAGNGSYDNRGCEAIIRGTAKILRHYFDDPSIACFSYFTSKKQFEWQRNNEYDDRIEHLPCYRLNKHYTFSNFYRPKVWKYIYYSVFDEERLGHIIHRDMLPFLPEASAVLSVGGDNYSLDYGKPIRFTTLDDLVLKHDKPLILWGASVGPFSNDPVYEQYMSHHLREVTGIFARESVTIDYLKSIDVTENVLPVADPAFLMDPVKPEGIDEDLPIDGDAIGLNLSPLMAKYVSGGNLDAWICRASSIIDDVARTTEMPIYLIPHVTNPTSNDHAFMQRALSRIENGDKNIVLVSSKYNAEEIKWIIGKMTLFAGARTHSTIAALSSNVPTLSCAYSIKAWGINKDLFGHTEYCMGPEILDAKNVTGRIMSMLDESTMIRRELMNKVGGIQKLALSAGTEVKRIMGEN